jgi:hypothetical protein
MAVTVVGGYCGFLKAAGEVRGFPLIHDKAVDEWGTRVLMIS